MNGFVSDDGKFVRARGYENQHAVPSGRFVHAEAQEFRLRGSHRIFNVFGTDADPDFAGGLVFGVMDCRDNAVVVQMFGKSFRVHNYQLPPAPPPPKLPPPPEKSLLEKLSLLSEKPPLLDDQLFDERPPDQPLPR